MKWYQRGSKYEHVMIWRADYDKAHRCPRRCTDECSGFVDGYEPKGRYFTTWAVHTCNGCGLRVARCWLLPSYPKAGDGYRNRMRLQFRNVRWWLDGTTYPGLPEFIARWKRRLHIR